MLEDVSLLAKSVQQRFVLSKVSEQTQLHLAEVCGDQRETGARNKHAAQVKRSCMIRTYIRKC